MTDPNVVLVRHGETPWNRDRRVQGWAPIGLTDRGREQAHQAGRFIAETYDIDRVLASDIQRTRDTTTIVREYVSAPVSFEAAWRERGFGVLQGLYYEALFDRFPEYSVLVNGQDAAARRPENGESLLETRDRVLDGWRTLTDGVAPGETILVITHGGPLYFVLAHLRGLTLADAIATLEQDNCGVTEVRVGQRGFEVVRENDTSWARGQSSVG